MAQRTPAFDLAFFQRLTDYAAQFAPEFPRSRPARWSAVYLQGLVLEGRRKSIEPLSRRVRLPPDLHSRDPEQALQQFLSQSPWDEKQILRHYRSLMAGAFGAEDGTTVIREVCFPKQGHQSIGVSRQFCEAAARTINCQVAVALHRVTRTSSYPLALRLYLPAMWLNDPQRLDALGVPLREKRLRTKAEIALDLLDRVRAEGFTGRVLAATADPTEAEQLRQALDKRGLEFHVRNALSMPLINSAVTEQVATHWAAAEQDYRLMRGQLGLGDFEGRSWRGFHHHVCMVFLAFGFLALERARNGNGG